jgi:hypothetical protein
MIRIDEIYNHTFWPWIKKSKSGTRVFFCDPPGRSDPDALFNLGNDSITETDYVFFHDQEPIHMDLHKPLFDDVKRRNADILANPPGHIVVSEKGEFVQELEERYGWKSHYYFYHGWACQDWYRGYDKSFLIPRARDRAPTKTFISPNRIVGGKRDHRVLFLYNIFLQNLEHNWISAPRICPYENVDISEVAKKYYNIYSDIEQSLLNADLPKLFPSEATQQMTSCWLTNFDESADSLIYVPTETVYYGNRLHITEKTFKAIALEMPFVLIAPHGSLEYMRSYGFKTFNGILDESYDEERDDIRRIEKVVDLLKEIDMLSVKERQQIHQALLPVVEYNFNHFYNGGLTEILWQELIGMLDGI